MKMIKVIVPVTLRIGDEMENSHATILLSKLTRETISIDFYVNGKPYMLLFQLEEL